MSNHTEISVPVSSIRIGDVLNGWIVTNVDIDDDNGFIRYIIAYTNADTGEVCVNDYRADQLVGAR